MSRGVDVADGVAEDVLIADEHEQPLSAREPRVQQVAVDINLCAWHTGITTTGYSAPWALCTVSAYGCYLLGPCVSFRRVTLVVTAAPSGC